MCILKKSMKTSLKIENNTSCKNDFPEMSFLLNKTQISRSTSRSTSSVLTLPLLWKFSRNLHLALSTPLSTCHLKHWHCFLVTAFVFSSVSDRVCGMAQWKPLLSALGYKVLFPYRSLFIVIGNIRSSAYHVLLPFLEGVQGGHLNKFILSMTDTFLNNSGNLWST